MGRPKLLYQSKCLTFWVRKDWEKPIREAVKSKKIELEKLENEQRT